MTGLDEAPDGTRPIRYFAAGEYGTKTERPHFHLLLFNTALPDWQGKTAGKVESPFIKEIWEQGFHQVGRFTAGRARYVAGYAAKKARGRIARQQEYGVYHPETGEYYERRPEFCTMSQGIGKYWFEKFREDVRRGYVVEKGGGRKRIPRYYREKLLRDEAFAEADDQRRAEFLANVDPKEDTPKRRRDKELVHRARLGSKMKDREF